MSYITIARGQEIADERLNVEAWEDASDANKTKALIMASDSIDQLNLKGDKPEDQVRQFPREGEDTVPVAIERATFEIALALLDGVDAGIEFENLNLLSQGYANIRSTYDNTTPNQHTLAGIPSIVAWRLLLPYIVNPRTVNVLRSS